MKHLALCGAGLLILASAVAAVAQPNSRAFTFDDLMKIRRVSDPQLSPDGRQIAYTITDVDKSANRQVTQIYLVASMGGEPKQLTTGAQSSTSPRWSPDGRRLAFISDRDGASQIWTLDIASGQLEKISNISTGADNPVWSPDGKMMAFTSDVYPECADDECNRQRDERMAQSKTKAKIADRLLYRHWKTWKEGKRSHIFVVPATGGAASAGRDLTPGDYDAPPFSLGGQIDYAFSPDSTELAFARNTDKVEAVSTNGDIFTVAVSGGAPRRITGANRANDLSPVYSRDGRYIAYRAQTKPGFESDRWRLMLYDQQTKQSRALTEQFDSGVESFSFASDGQRIFFVAAERGKQPVYAVMIANGEVKKVVAAGYNDDVQVAADGSTLVFTRQSIARPVEIFRAAADGSGVVQITKTNDAMFATVSAPVAEEMTWEGAEGTPVHGFVVKPANFSEGKKWPLVVLIHGGPQGAFNDAWSYRWNPQVFAGAGYVVLMPNPRGSTGYGQRFVDEVSGDWGGRSFIDIKNGVAKLSAADYIDRERIAAAGGSYGGYMVNWIEGHNDDPRFRFRTLVSHAGVFNLASMAGATEELWFVDWEFKGRFWDSPAIYEKWSPHRFVKNFKTPMLVTHGELDFRVPVGESLQLFTALQLQNVESRLLYFPDEGHWIQKPQNSEIWYSTVLEWLSKYLKPNTA